MPGERIVKSKANQPHSDRKPVAQTSVDAGEAPQLLNSDSASIVALQSLVGNRNVQRMLAEGKLRQHQDKTQEAALSPDEATFSVGAPHPGQADFTSSIQPQMLTGSVKHVQRDGAAPAPAQAAVNVNIDGMNISNFGELAAWYQLHKMKLQQQIDEMNKDNVPAPVSVQAAIDLALPDLNAATGRGQEAVDTPAVIKAQAWLDYKYIRAMNDAEGEKGAAAAQRLRETARKTQEAQEHLENTILPQMRDMQRSAFRKGNQNGLLAAADTVATIVDTLLATKTTILAIGEEAAVLENMRNVAQGYKGLFPSANSKLPAIMEIAEKVNKVYAGFQLVRAAIDMATGKKTESDSGKAGVSAMSTVISAGGTLLGASAGMTVYANLYIGPMVSACLEMLSKIEDVLSRGKNRELIELGEFDTVNWTIEPGGRPVFNFMLQVMHASDEAGIPTPIPKTVSDYFVDNDGDFSAGVGGKDEMPTKGFWFFKKLDSSKIQQWVFRNRNNLWGMLYGACQVPN